MQTFFAIFKPNTHSDKYTFINSLIDCSKCILSIHLVLQLNNQIFQVWVNLWLLNTVKMFNIDMSYLSTSITDCPSLNLSRKCIEIMSIIIFTSTRRFLEKEESKINNSNTGGWYKKGKRESYSNVKSEISKSWPLLKI